MYRFFKKFHLERYFSSKLILAIDLFVSVVASMFSLFLIQALLHPITTGLVSFTIKWLLCSAIATLAAIVVFKTHYGIIRHSTLREIGRLGMAVLLKDALMLFALMVYKDFTFTSADTLVVICDTLFSCFSLVAMRVAMVLVYDLVRFKGKENRHRIRTLVYGVSDKSVALVKRLASSPHYVVVGFIDFGNKQNHTINNLPVYNFNVSEDLKQVVSQTDIDSILFANEDEARNEQNRLLKFCNDCGVRVLVAPKIDEVLDGKVRKGIREVKIEDLLGREEIKISMDEIIAGFRDKVVMVTGAAGSIGSELCRQLATFGVKKLVLFDNAETPMHQIRLELEGRFPDLDFVPIIGDVRQLPRIDFAFRNFKPQVVFHAAAYKHVPLMEENPCEAVLVNVIGSRNIADKCIEYNVEKMVMISTDKAVNPTNIMGASKRICEMIIQTFNKHYDTEFVAVRFGNVLGSNGSVIPLFKKQIMAGGPVTVTHPDIIRYFMTIPEAVSLVLQAGAYCKGGEIFVLDMGKPVKILDLAKNLIRLSGYRVDEDIKIEFTGLRPGEKLYEELLMAEEGMKETANKLIYIGKPIEIDEMRFFAQLKELKEASKNESCDIRPLVKEIVPTYHYEEEAVSSEKN